MASTPATMAVQASTPGEGRKAEPMHGSQLFIDEIQGTGMPVLLLVGDLDIHTSSAFGYRVRDLRRQGHQRIGLDLSLVEYVDPTGVSAIVREFEECRRTRRHLVILEASAGVRKVLGLLDLAHMLKVGEDGAVRRLSPALID